MKSRSWWSLGLALIPLNAGAQTAQPTQAPAAQPAQAPAAQPPPPPPSLPAALTATPGGMTAEQAAQRAVRTSAQVRAAHASTDAADSARTEAALGMLPQIALSARYTRLSDITPPSLGSSFSSTQLIGQQDTSAVPAANLSTPCLSNGSIVPGGILARDVNGTRVLLPQCPPGTQPLTTAGAAFRFPVILDQFAFRGTLTIPLTDIPFRLARVYEAAGLTHQARRFDEEAAREQAATDARVAFYEYMRAQGNVAIAEQGAGTARGHREDLARFVEAGTVPRVELLRVESQLAESDRLVISARENVALAEAQLRLRLHLGPEERITLGESLAEPVEFPGTVQTLLDRAMRERPELASLDRQTRALDANLSATRAALFPSVSAQANLDVANPNQRFVPQQQQFNTTWDATIQIQWSPTGAIQTGATASRISAQLEGLRAQLAAVREGLELEVRGAWVQVQGARASIEAANRQVVAAEESYRVRRERFIAGAAVSSDLTDAELDLLRARFALVNANVDLREGVARLRRAAGERVSMR